jgi:cytochrome c oxidase subunit 2
MEYTNVNNNVGYSNLIVDNSVLLDKLSASFSILDASNIKTYLLTVCTIGFVIFLTWKSAEMLGYLTNWKKRGDECCCGGNCDCCSGHQKVNESYGTKSSLVLKKGDDECCCGGGCSCCCGHSKAHKPEAITFSRTRSTRMKWGISSLKADVPLAWGLYFQDGATPSFEGIVDLHNRIMFYLVVILFGVSWVMLSIMWNFNKSENKLVYRYLNHGTLIELIWTVGPALVLVAIAFPSFKLLYLMDEVIDPAMTVKVTGHQWYWEYEYADFLNEENETINFDSYMKDEASLEEGELRMLEVDNAVVLPIDTHIRFIITGADVLHDWAVPALALKVDAAPGRLNQASVIIERTGFFYGQCSEICGVLHSSMPIKIEAVEVEKFFSWLLEQ